MSDLKIGDYVKVVNNNLRSCGRKGYVDFVGPDSIDVNLEGDILMTYDLTSCELVKKITKEKIQ